ncbi:hypothetical protein [Clostridium pasteurianum]|uniref:Uncharacterized protein n=1 Tax=Clostridium pasteurianum BC1 TaxID=86416 RepID=R4KAI2_CLOPA|nr:hypothetical protein [Clostridium pasteurianum]AGK96650.1 hypothetical protein Clopa_1731 [Clostridium pasteurianum BC1]
MKQLKRETLPGLRTGITVRTKLASIAQAICVNGFIWGAGCLNWARPVLKGAVSVKITVYLPHEVQSSIIKSVK